MHTESLDYALDPGLIAQHPLAERDGGRLLVLGRERGVCAHSTVRRRPDWLRPRDLLVVNDAEVIPARLRGERDSGGAVELLLTEPIRPDEGLWSCLGRRTRRLHEGEVLRFGGGLEGVWEGGEGMSRRVRLRAPGDLDAAIRIHGEVPLPPYIHRPTGPLPEDRERYQTVFARVPGAVAAPTAGLHFTPALLARLEAGGVARAAVTLLVGPATFLPIRESVDEHTVPSERYDISAQTAAAIAATRAAGGRVVAVGTTTVRALESAADERGVVRPGPGRADLVISPGYRFRVVDALVTNLHLPRSSLLALVAAFGGVDGVLDGYRAAARAGYRFYSYGDAMLIQ